jgi:hypothetical protein
MGFLAYYCRYDARHVEVAEMMKKPIAASVRIGTDPL